MRARARKGEASARRLVRARMRGTGRRTVGVLRECPRRADSGDRFRVRRKRASARTVEAEREDSALARQRGPAVMIKCPFYQVHMHQPSGTARREQELAIVPHEPFPWCSHAHSVVSMLDATQSEGGQHKLRCGGDVERCQLAPEWQPPFDPAKP